MVGKEYPGSLNFRGILLFVGTYDFRRNFNPAFAVGALPNTIQTNRVKSLDDSWHKLYKGAGSISTIYERW
jgi:hypothetical protein